MFFFKKKDYRHYLNQGEKYLAAERYADARCSYQDALERCPSDASDDRDHMLTRLGETGNRLAELNLLEGDGAMNGGERDKAYEHFHLAFELAADTKLREIAAQKMRRAQQVKTAPSSKSLNNTHKHHAAHSGGCNTCGGHSAQGAETEEISGPGFSPEDNLELLVHPLPGDLPQRYLSLGREFAEAYLLIHDADDARAFPILKELLGKSPNDIVMYELALIMFRAGRLGECKGLLADALNANPSNPLCYLAQVHLAMAQQHFADALGVLERMMELDILPDQARYLMGEVTAAAGDHEAALSHWSQALNIPSVARPAAEKVVALLTELGRQQEAQFVAKRYLKGCC